MEETNWRVIGHKLKAPKRSPHDQAVLQIERDKRKDRPYMTIMRLKEHIAEPSTAENHCSIDRDEPKERTIEISHNQMACSEM
jgi:hypothetical protein